ncbi:hypothetical protein [Metallosphaera sp.]|uniref:hypothetical protein n=1 Tax=Metallosphaera sp. TaxID=2020860 RepID=UPI003170C146
MNIDEDTFQRAGNLAKEIGLLAETRGYSIIEGVVAAQIILVAVASHLNDKQFRQYLVQLNENMIELKRRGDQADKLLHRDGFGEK